MILAPYMFKAKAMKALRGNWQTALLVSFFSGVLVTGYSLAQVEVRVDLYAASTEAMLRSMEASLMAIPAGSWILYGTLLVLSLLLTPMLELGCNHYFICRLNGEELGFAGLFSRVRLWGKAIWLKVYVGVKVAAWALLFLVPGIIAAIRYSQAAYYLAEDPTLSVREAVKKSKDAMQTAKLSYFILQFSFFGWALLATALQYLLVDVNVILALVLYQCVSLFVSTYMNGANAAFYLAIGAGEPFPLEEADTREE